MAGDLNLTETQRMCIVCREVLHISQFSERSAQYKPWSEIPYRAEVCKGCDSAYQAARKEEKKKKVLEEVIRKLGATKQIEVPHTSELAAAISKQIGGPDKFAEMFARNMDSACTANPGSKTALEYMKTFKDLIVKSTDQRETAPDVPLLSDEQLEVELQDRLMRLLSENPQLASQVIEANTKAVPNLAEEKAETE